MYKIKVIIAEDHLVVRQGLKVLLREAADLEIIGEAEDGMKAVKLAQLVQPDVVLMDVAMPNLNGLKATEAILKKMPQVKVLVLSSYSDEDLVKSFIRAGAAGYVTKHAASEQLLQAIRQVYRGFSYFSPPIAARILRASQSSFVNGNSSSEKRRGLTRREEEVLVRIAQGLSNKQIATELWLSVKTVEKHRHQVMSKLDVHETAGLTRYAVNKGLISLRQNAAA